MPDTKNKLEELSEKLSNLDCALDELRSFIDSIIQDEEPLLEDLAWEVRDEAEEIGEILLDMLSMTESVTEEF